LQIGKYWNVNITGNLVSNVANEGYIFVSEDVKTEAAYDAYLAEFLPGKALEPQRAAVKEKYDCKNNPLGYRICVAGIVAHAVFTCNTRDLVTAHPNNTYVMEYQFPFDGAAFHGTDLIPEFTSTVEEAATLMNKSGLPLELASLLAQPLTNQVSFRFHTYLTSFALYGEPNLLSRGPYWPQVSTDGDAFENVMQARAAITADGAWGTITDKKSTKNICSFWKGIAKEVSKSSSLTLEDGVDSDYVYHDSSEAPLEL
jgi:carboxylesterase type B